MNKIKFVKNSRVSQIIIKSQKGQALDDRAIYAISNNQLNGFVKMMIERKGVNFKLIYNTTGLMVLRDYLRNMMNRELFTRLLQNIRTVLQSVQDANFFTQCVVLDVNYSFIDAATHSVYFVYAPIQNFESVGTLRDFLLEVVQNSSFASEEDNGYIREYVSILNKNPAFSVFDLSDYINYLNNGTHPSASKQDQPPKCPRCGNVIKGHIKFCATCGLNVTNITGASLGQQGDPDNEPPWVNPRRGDSQPIDLMGIPTKLPQIVQSAPSILTNSSHKPQYPPLNNFAQNSMSPQMQKDVQQNKPQYPPQNPYAQQNDQPYNYAANNAAPKQNEQPYNYAANNVPQQNEQPYNYAANNAQQNEQPYNYAANNAAPQQNEQPYNYAANNAAPQQNEQPYNYAANNVPKQNEQPYNYAANNVPKQNEQPYNYAANNIPQQNEQPYNYAANNAAPQQNEQPYNYAANNIPQQNEQPYNYAANNVPKQNEQPYNYAANNVPKQNEQPYNYAANNVPKQNEQNNAAAQSSVPQNEQPYNYAKNNIFPYSYDSVEDNSEQDSSGYKFGNEDTNYTFNDDEPETGVNNYSGVNAQNAARMYEPNRNESERNQPQTPTPPQSEMSPGSLQYNLGEPPQSFRISDIAQSFDDNYPKPRDDDPYFAGTVVLTDNEPIPTAAYLTRLSTGEKKLIDKPQFTVGRMMGHVDYCVANNSAIGRQHIKIINNNGRYFICDLNSTNGTYIDDREIPRNVDTEVFSGAKVTLANEDFKFTIE